MSFFTFIEDVFSTIIKGAKRIFTPENIEKGKAVAKRISDLIVLSSPYAEMLAKVTPTEADDELVAAAGRMNLTVQQILNESDASVRKGRILTLIGHAVRGKIESVVASGDGKIKIGDISIRVSDDMKKVAGDLFDSAAQMAYSLFIKARPELAPAASGETANAPHAPEE